MRVTNLRLEQFRKHQDSTLAIGDAAFVCIRGKNFSGKTSIGQGLSMVLTSTTTALDAQGKGFVSKIKRGASKAVITADVQGKHHLIRRVLTLNTNKSGRNQYSVCLDDPDWNPAPFDRQLEANKAALSVALNTDAFMRMDEKEQKNLLARLALPARYDFDQRIVESVERVLGRGTVNFSGQPFAVIQDAYKALYQEREIVNRQVKEFHVPEPLPIPAGVDSYGLQDRLTSLRMKRRDQEKLRDEAVEAASKQQAERERYEAKRQTLLTDERLAALRQVASRKEEFDRLQKAKKVIESSLDEYLRRAARIDELMEATYATCPNCDQAIDRTKLEAMSQDAAKDIDWAKNENFAIYQVIKGLGDVEEAIKLIR